MDKKYTEVNLEDGKPTCELAIRRLTFHVNSKKELGYCAVKIIHGYGSSGAGGRIRVKAREYLASLKRRGVIRDFIPGETFSIFDAATRKALDAVPEMRADRDLERHNNGITVILL